MNSPIFEPLVCIDYNRTIELHDAFGTEVLCVRGCLWVHEDRLGDDRILRAGESCCIGRTGRTLVTALEPSLMHAPGSSRPRAPSPIETGGRDARVPA